jgi:FkbM family methyltransferase
VEILMRFGRVMQHSRLAPLYRPAKKVAFAALRAKAAAEFALAQVIRALLGLLPTAVQAKAKHAFAPTATLDYRAHKILLHVDSAGALYRTSACRKEPETVRWIEEYIRPGEVLYDVGANVGAYSLIASKHCGGNVRVLAFEPSFASYDELCRNVVLNQCEASVIPYLMCLTESAGPIVFRHTSLEPGSALHLAGESDIGTGFTAVYTQELMGFPVDFLVSQFGFPVPNHMKIDVDGTEINVLRGAASTLDSDRVQTIQVEVSPRHPSAAEVITLLVEKRFRLLSETARGGGDRWSNYLFVRP